MSDPPPRRTALRPLVVLGEIRTCLLPHSTALDGEATDELLALVPGASVRRRERPGPLAFSPSKAIGVDCHLAWGSTDSVRIVGTVASTAVLVGGRLSQMSSHTTVVRAPQRKRQPWSHYTSQIGVTEVIGKLPIPPDADQELIAGYRTAPSPTTLDLSSVCARQLGDLHRSPQLDQRPPLRAPTTRLRWTAQIGGNAGPAVSFRVEEELTRTANVIVRAPDEIPDALRFCQDVAVHDWLLTVIDAKVLAAEGLSHGQQVAVLAPILEHLAHLWMPGAHVPSTMRSQWRDLQAEANFTKQWTTRVEQVERRIEVATYHAVRGAISAGDW
ncbi:SCO2521 family protein [Nocardia sp. XZ_19_385]|uniref:SCO2521 family protein n=1 Tax=Nocardia sp. XZ_19_385 TaxID=2769488 RepID=UPI001890B548|nr:SCO2521 family protein [Nocardia sp. XZ_19_385]